MNPVSIILFSVIFFVIAVVMAIIVWRSSKTAVPILDAKRSLRMADMARLSKLRQEIECYSEFDVKSVCLFYDICVALDFNQAQVQHILGPAYWLVINASIDL
ncbi:MAG: hypothetical protein D6816_16385, partial [Bacteroidetes bacterium]